MPPCAPGGTECGRASPATATPTSPRKGRSGKTSEPASSSEESTAMRPVQPSGPGWAVAKTQTGSSPSGSSPGKAPRPWRLETVPYGARGRSCSTVTASTSPGSAPATAMGPVTTCGPSASASWGTADAAIPIASRSTASAGTPLPANHATGSRPWSSRTPSWLTVSMVTVLPAVGAAGQTSPEHGLRRRGEVMPDGGEIGAVLQQRHLREGPPQVAGGSSPQRDRRGGDRGAHAAKPSHRL